ncbi:MAG: hypothetical protein COA78_26595 [Blastopirellula sp.]|nr:MAG: hypothetical protein COA78_26595 [Blastopirellula sp.]
MDEAMNSAEQDVPLQTAAPSLPQFSIADLIIWTACVALSMSLLRLLPSQERFSLFNFYDVLHLGYAIYYGVILALIIHWLRYQRVWRGYEKSMPGHYFILLPITLLSMSEFSESLHFLLQPPGKLNIGPSIHLLTASLVPAHLYYMWKRLHPDRWSIVVLIGLLMYAWIILLRLIDFAALAVPGFYFSFHLFNLESLGTDLLISAAFVSTLAILISDIKNKVPRDWLHSVSVCCLLIFNAVWLIDRVWQSYYYFLASIYEQSF